MNDALSLASTRPASQQDGSHPRPTMLREGWCSLDRTAGFAHDDDLVGLDALFRAVPVQLLESFVPEANDHSASVSRAVTRYNPSC